MKTYKIHLVGMLTLTFKEIYRYYKVIGQTLLAPVVTNGLYLIVFTIMMKNRTVGNSNISYLQFLIPGLIIMGVLTNSFANSCSSLIISKYNKTITDLLVVPLSPLDLTLAFLIGAITRGFLVGIVTFITAKFFIQIEIIHPVLALTVLLLSSGSFALLGTILGIKFNDYDQVATIQNFILTPLSFLGGVFYSIKQLPNFFSKIALFNPVTYMINALRYSMIGVSDIDVKLALFLIASIFVILFIITLKLFKSGNGLRQ